MLLSKLTPDPIPAGWQLESSSCSVTPSSSLPVTADVLSVRISQELCHQKPSRADKKPCPRSLGGLDQLLAALHLCSAPSRHSPHIPNRAATVVFSKPKLRQGPPLSDFSGAPRHTQSDPMSLTQAARHLPDLLSHPGLTHSRSAALASVMFLEHMRPVGLFPPHARD